MPKKPKIPVPEGFAELNLNQYVMVRLTAEGKEILMKDAKETIDRLDEPDEDFSNPESWLPEEDENGWSEWQLWVLIKTFSKHLDEWHPLPFEMTVGVPIKLNRTPGWRGSAVQEPVKTG